MIGDIIIAFMIAFLVAYVATPYSIRFAKKVGAVDNPKDSERKIHKKTMPRLGGLAVIISFVASALYLLIVMSIEKNINLFDSNKYIYKIVGILAGIIILGIFCFFDDKKGIKPYVKLFGQVLATVIVIACGVRIEHLELQTLKLVIDKNIILDIITFVWIIGVTNAINLTDGLDGLASGVSLIACISLIIVFALNGSNLISILLSAALAGAILGFLPYNFNPARTFLGDTGSNFLGFMLSIIAIMRNCKNIYSNSNNSTIISICSTNNRHGICNNKKDYYT